MALYRLDTLTPEVPDSAWVADSASVIGQVVLGENVSIWPGVVVRAENAEVRIGRDSNVQDNSVLHVDDGVPLHIGDGCTIGHQVMLHGCTIGDGSLVGIGAVVLNRARIGRNCLVGAGALVTEGKEFPDGSLIMGSPAKVLRELSPEQLEGLRRSAAGYVANGARFKRGLVRIA